MEEPDPREKFSEYVETQKGVIADRLELAKKSLKLREWDTVVTECTEACRRIVKLYLELLESENPALREMSLPDMLENFDLPIDSEMREFLELAATTDVQEIRRQKNLFDFARQLTGEELYEEESVFNKIYWDRLAYAYYKITQQLRDQLLEETVSGEDESP